MNNNELESEPFYLSNRTLVKHLIQEKKTTFFEQVSSVNDYHSIQHVVGTHPATD